MADPTSASAGGSAAANGSNSHSHCGGTGAAACGAGAGGTASVGVGTSTTGGGGNLAEELDNLMDISMEIASNKRMKKDYIKPFRLTFKDEEMEKKVRKSVNCRHKIIIPNHFLRQYCLQRDYTFKSSLFCLVGVWILVFFSELFQIHLHNEW